VSSIKKDIRTLARRLDLYLAGESATEADLADAKTSKLRTTSTLLRAGYSAPDVPTGWPVS